MIQAALALSILALGLALIGWLRSTVHASRLDDLEQDLPRQQRNLSNEVEEALVIQRRLLAKIAKGEELDPDQVEAWHRLARCCRRLGDHDAADHAERQRDAAIERTQPRQGFPE